MSRENLISVNTLASRLLLSKFSINSLRRLMETRREETLLSEEETVREPIYLNDIAIFLHLFLYLILNIINIFYSF
jgi:hypothetical protein